MNETTETNGVDSSRPIGVIGLWIVYVLIAAAAQGVFGKVTGGAG